MRELQGIVWAKTLAALDRARVCQRIALETYNKRRDARLLRVMQSFEDDFDRERSSYEPALDKGRLEWSRPVVFLDIETTGLDPATSEITEIGLVVCDRYFRYQREISIRVIPSQTAIDSRDGWIDEHTSFGRDFGLDVERWTESGAVSIETALVLIAPMIFDCAPFAHGLEFDLSFIRAAIESIDPATVAQNTYIQTIGAASWARHGQCTRALSAPLRALGYSLNALGEPTRSLAAVARCLGVRMERHHDALSDARTCCEIAKILLNAEI